MAAFLDFLKSAGNFAAKAAPIAAPIVGGYFASKAARDAAEMQAQGGQNALMGFRPYSELGDTAAGELERRLTPEYFLNTFDMEDFQKDPGYQFRLGEGEKAIDRYLGARGLRHSGRMGRELVRYNQGFASNELNNAFNRFQQDQTRQYNSLAGPVQLGAGAAGSAGNALIGIGNVNASGRVGANNNIMRGVEDAIRNYQMQQSMRRFYGS